MRWLTLVRLHFKYLAERSHRRHLRAGIALVVEAEVAREYGIVLCRDHD